MKKCSKCGELKSINEFYKDKNKKDSKRSHCKKCSTKEAKDYYLKHSTRIKEYYKNIIRQRNGHISMYENKSCSSYLGIVIGESLCKYLFKDVEVMPMHNPGFDIICNRGKKIDVKTSSIRKGKYPSWSFKIRKNTIADFFIFVAFDNVKNLNPLYMWLIPGKEINNQAKTQISLSTIHKWNKWKRNINDVQLCCSEMKKGEI